MTDYKFAHFIINYNGKRYLPELLNTLRKDSGDIFIFNNDLPDDLEGLSLENVVIIQNTTNKTFSQSVNDILEYAYNRGYDFISILNNDIYMITPFVQPMVSFMIKKGLAIASPVIVYANRPSVIQSCGVVATIDGRIEDKYDGFYIGDMDYNVCENPFAVSFAAVVLDLGRIGDLRMDTDFKSYFEDVDFCLRAKSKGLNIGINSSVIVAHYGSASFSLFPEKKIYLTSINRLRLLLKHQPFSIFWEYCRWEKRILIKKYLVKKFPLMFVRLLVHSSALYLKYFLLRWAGKIKGYVFPIVSYPLKDVTNFINICNPEYFKCVSVNMPFIVLPGGMIVEKKRIRLIGGGEFSILCKTEKIYMDFSGNGIVNINGKDIFIAGEERIESDSIVKFSLKEGIVYLDYAECKD